MISYNETETELIVIFQGSLDTYACLKIETELYEKIRATEKEVVFDMKEVNYIASMFLRVCIKVVKEIGKEKFSLTNVSDQIVKIFKLTKLDRFLKILA